MIDLRFTVLGKPQPKQRARRGRGGAFYTPTETRTYQKRVGDLAHRASQYEQRGGFWVRRHDPWPDPFHCKRTKSSKPSACQCDWCRRCYLVELDVFFPDRRPRDVDNVAKSILDGLNGVLWRDDRQVLVLRVEKHLDRERPRVEIFVGNPSRTDLASKPD